MTQEGVVAPKKGGAFHGRIVLAVKLGDDGDIQRHQVEVDSQSICGTAILSPSPTYIPVETARKRPRVELGRLDSWVG